MLRYHHIWIRNTTDNEECFQIHPKADDYVNNNVMGYDRNKLSNHMIYRLTGLREGKYLQNPKTKAKAYYSFKVILHCSILKSNSIKSSLVASIASLRYLDCNS